MESLDRDLYFCTLTYNSKMLRHIEVNGYKLAYADFTDVQKMFKRLRKRGVLGDDFRYIIVSEYGGKNHRPHFHMILSMPSEGKDLYDKQTKAKFLHDVILKEWCRNEGTRRKPKYVPLCTFIVTPKGRTFDLHYIEPSLTANGSSDVAFYVTKYICKYSSYVESLKSALKLNLDLEDFTKVWHLLKPRCVTSKGFGNIHSEKVKKHIRKGIDVAIQDPNLPYPIFINPSSGQEFPLSPYYKKKFLTMRDAHSFFYKDDCKEDEHNPHQFIQDDKVQQKMYDKQCDFLDDKYTNVDFDFLEID